MVNNHLSEEQRFAAEIGLCFTRLNQLAKRMARARRPRQADIDEASRLRRRIALLKRGEWPPSEATS